MMWRRRKKSPWAMATRKPNDRLAVLFCRSSRSTVLLAALLELRHGLEHSPFQPRELLVESPAVFQEWPEGDDHTARGRFVLQHHEPGFFRFAGHGFAFLGMTPSWRVAL